MKGATLNIDSFGRNKIDSGGEALLREAYNLIVMKPGTDPLNPNKGCDLNSYYYRAVKSNEYQTIERKINNQIQQYLGVSTIKVQCKVLDTDGKKILHCFLTLLPYTSNLALISTNGQYAEYTNIHNESQQLIKNNTFR